VQTVDVIQKIARTVILRYHVQTVLIKNVVVGKVHTFMDKVRRT
jgi:hypothetical protein